MHDEFAMAAIHFSKSLGLLEKQNSFCKQHEHAGSSQGAEEMIDDCLCRAPQWTFYPAYRLYAHCGRHLLPITQTKEVYDNGRCEM